VEAPGTADWDAGCADARKTPRQGVQGVSRNRLRRPGPARPETHESLISRKTVAEVLLTGLSFKATAKKAAKKAAKQAKGRPDEGGSDEDA